MFLVVVTMLFVIAPMALAPATMFDAVIAALIAAIGVIFVALTIVGNVGIVVWPRTLADARRACLAGGLQFRLISTR
jgi:hypothetical protein